MRKYMRNLLCGLIVLIMLWLTWKKAFAIENFDNSNKILYLVWQNLKSNVDELHKNGFGDKIRGALALHQFCVANEIPIVVDATEDICGRFLKNVKYNDFETEIRNQKVHSFNQFSDLDNEMKSLLKSNDKICLITNCFPKNELSDEDKAFAKFVCTPTDEMKTLIDKSISILPNNYGIQHFRFSDDVFNNDVSSDDLIFKKFFDILTKSYKPTDVLITNSNNFKKYAKDNIGISTIPCFDESEFCELAHIGEKTNEKELKQSFLEFFIVEGAKYIKTSSIYEWESNFVLWTRKIHDIPTEFIHVQI